MGFEQLQAFVVVSIGLCGAIVTIGGAAAAVAKFWEFAHRKTDNNAETIAEFEQYLASDKRRIESLERKQDEAEEQNRLMLKALVTLMSHELDGNHTAQLEESRNEIQDYLIRRA